MASGNGVRHTRLSQSVSGESGMVVRHSSVQRCRASTAGVATTSPACCRNSSTTEVMHESACAPEMRVETGLDCSLQAVAPTRRLSPCLTFVWAGLRTKNPWEEESAIGSGRNEASVKAFATHSDDCASPPNTHTLKIGCRSSNPGAGYRLSRFPNGGTHHVFKACFGASPQ